MPTIINGNTGVDRVAPNSIDQEDLKWVPPFTKEYNSPAQAMANSALFTLAHGLGVEPRGIQLIAQCKVVDGGYSVGNRIRLSPGAGISNTAGACPVVWADATNIYVRCFSNNFAYVLVNGSAGTLMHTSWDLYVRAWA